MPRRTINPQSTLLLAVLALGLTAVLPLRFTAWTGWFRGPFTTIIAPVSGPVSALASRLRPPEDRRTDEDTDAEDLRLQRDFYRGEYLRAEQQIETLRQLIEALQAGVAYGPALRLRRLEASRVGIGLDPRTIDVSRGSVHGVVRDTVAVATTAPQHLVGIVSAVGPTVSTIHLITDRRVVPNLLDALVVPASSVTPESLARAPRCQFRPIGDGTLAGDISAEDAQRTNLGDAALLDDPSWPLGAQRLIIGRVSRKAGTDNPLFTRLIIRPDLDPAGVRSVVLRIPDVDDAPPNSAAGGGS